MRQLYTIFIFAYIFVILTSYAVYDAFGINRGIFASVFIFLFLYILDIIVDHFLFQKIETFTVTWWERIKLTLFAGLFWIVAEVVFIGLDMIFYGYGDLTTLISILTNPMILLSGGLMGIAVWSSLGYGLSKNKKR